MRRLLPAAAAQTPRKLTSSTLTLVKKGISFMTTQVKLCVVLLYGVSRRVLFCVLVNKGLSR